MPNTILPTPFDLIGNLDSFGEEGVFMLALLAHPMCSFSVDGEGNHEKIGPFSESDIEQISERIVSIAQENGSIRSTIDMPDWAIRGRVGAYNFLIKNSIFGISLSFSLGGAADDCSTNDLGDADVDLEEVLGE